MQSFVISQQSKSYTQLLTKYTLQHRNCPIKTIKHNAKWCRYDRRKRIEFLLWGQIYEQKYSKLTTRLTQLNFGSRCSITLVVKILKAKKETFWFGSFACNIPLLSAVTYIRKTTTFHNKHKNPHCSITTFLTVSSWIARSWCAYNFNAKVCKKLSCHDHTYLKYKSVVESYSSFFMLGSKRMSD